MGGAPNSGAHVSGGASDEEAQGGGGLLFAPARQRERSGGQTEGGGAAVGPGRQFYAFPTAWRHHCPMSSCAPTCFFMKG